VRPALLPIAAALSAAATLSVEIAVVRLGAPYIGQSLLPWSAAITGVLCGLAFGHLLGGRAGGTGAGILRLRTWLCAAWLAASLGALTMPLLAPALVPLPSGAEGLAWPAVLGLAGLVFPPSLAAGLVQPLMLRLTLAGDAGASPRRIAAILAASTTGSVAGTVAAGFLLLERVGGAGLAGGAGLVWLVLAAAAMPWDARSRARSALVASAAAGIGGALVLLGQGASPCHTETRYTCIRLFDHALPGGGLLRLMMLDESPHSASDRDDPAKLHFAYTALLDALARPVLAEAPEPRALFVGGGGATLPRAWAVATPPVSVTVAELDGRVAEEAARAMWAGRSHITTVIGDGRAVLRGLPPGPPHQVVVLDAYRTHSVPPHLVTREFAAMVRQRLGAGGVHLSNVVDRAGTMQLSLSVAATLETVFPVVEIWVLDGTDIGLTNAVVAAWRDPPGYRRPDTTRVEATSWDAGGVTRAEEVTWRRLDRDAAARRWPGACAVVLTDDWAPVDRLIAGPHACGASPSR
jgi:spermidine synthase